MIAACLIAYLSQRPELLVLAVGVVSLPPILKTKESVVGLWLVRRSIVNQVARVVEEAQISKNFLSDLETCTNVFKKGK